MKCGEIRELLPLYADGMLNEELAEQVALHIADCPACKRELTELRALSAVLTALPEEEPPAGYEARLSETLRCAAAGETCPENPEETERVVVAGMTAGRKRSFLKKVSSLCAIFVVGIFALAMYNNIDQLIPLSDGGAISGANESTKESRSAVTEENASESFDYVAEDLTADSVSSVENGTAAYGAARYSGEASAALTDAAPQSGVVQYESAGEVQKEESKAMFSAERDASENAADEVGGTASGGGGGSAKAMPETENGDAADSAAQISRSGDPFVLPSRCAADMTTDGAFTGGNADSRALRCYTRLLEQTLYGQDFEILSCENTEDDFWRFEIQIVSTDENKNNVLETVFYYGQDGTIWREE